MKTLQNNFTTPEQSKRLLELGVPVWTADGQYNDFNGNILVLPDWSVFSPIYENNTRKPCWSVGRLMEIIALCTYRDTPEYDRDYIECLIEVIESCDDGDLDFSKLED